MSEAVLSCPEEPFAVVLHFASLFHDVSWALGSEKKYDKKKCPIMIKHSKDNHSFVFDQ